VSATAIGALIPLVVIAGAIGYAILLTYWRSKEKWSRASGAADLRKALADSTAASQAILERLDTLDARLAVVERTLTEIPS
jgi:hypothetical protein